MNQTLTYTYRNACQQALIDFNKSKAKAFQDSLDMPKGPLFMEFLSHAKLLFEEGVKAKKIDLEQKEEFNNFLKHVATQWPVWINSSQAKKTELLEQKKEQKATVQAKRKAKDIESSTVSHSPSLCDTYIDYDPAPCIEKGKEGGSWRQIQGPCKALQANQAPVSKKKVRRRLDSNVNKHRKMLKSLSPDMMNLQRLGVAETQVHNITNTDIPQSQIEALAYGINFIPTPLTDHSVIDKAMSRFRRTVRLKWHFRLKESEVPQWHIPNIDWKPPTAHHKLEEAMNLLDTQLKNSTPDHYPTNWTSHQQRQLNLLLKNKNILVITADKNLGYVICTTQWYKSAVESHLSDANMYEDVSTKFLGSDQGVSFTKNLYMKLENMVQDYSDTLPYEVQLWILQKEDFKPMKFYITAKVHKFPVKGRPIAPGMNWVTFHLSEYIAAELNHYKDELSTVLKDSTQFVNEIEALSLQTQKSKPKQIWLVGLDITAMYPNLDTKTGLFLINQFLEEVEYRDEKHRDFLIRAMEFTLTEGYLKWGNKIYRQKNGAAMGSPFSPPYADIFMYMLERVYIDIQFNEKKLLLYKRYLDDVFAVIQGSKQDAELFVKGMNELEPDFIELTGNISQTMIFLDVTVKWSCRTHKLTTQVFQKPMNRYPYLPWKSFHTKGMKKGFIKGEAIRYARLCSRKRGFKYLISLFILRLLKRGYPKSFISKALSSVEWEKRHEYLKYKSKDKKLPFLFPILYNQAPNKQVLRDSLNSLAQGLDNWDLTPVSLKGKITICNMLPDKLHKQILKSRASKGF